MIKKLWMLALPMLLGLASCTSDVADNAVNISVQEQDLIGLWWDEFEYSDVTEAGVPFSRVILAVKADADHTGCLYLGAFDDTSDEPLAVYGGPEDAGFTWHLLADGRVLLSDPTSGESIALTRAADEGSYGEGMTDVSSTSVSVAEGSMTVTNGDYSGTLEKADAPTQADLEEKLATLSPDRQEFEANLSQMLADSQQYIRLDPTMRAVNLLTEFVNQLKIDALGPQLAKIIVVNVLSKKNMIANIDLKENAEARWALDNSNVPNPSAESAGLFNAAIILSNSALEFTTGKDTADFVTTDDGAFTISCKNTTSGAVTKVRMTFRGNDDGVIIFLADLGRVPVAIQFPHLIDMELLRSESGNEADTETVMKGQLAMESTDGKKYISLKRGEWRLSLSTDAQKADRYEMPAFTLTHHADHTIETDVSLAVNGNNVLSVKGRNFADPYTDEELEQLRELRDIAPIWKGCYTLLKAFNSRTDKIEMTLTDNLVFDIDVLDAGQCLKAAAYALKQRHQQPSKETMDPWTDLLNKSIACTVTQKSTGVKAEAKFITSLFDGDYLPSVALRFKGESDFQVFHDRLNPTDRQNYEALVNGFDEPFAAVNALLKAFQDKGVELKEFSPFQKK